VGTAFVIGNRAHCRRNSFPAIELSELSRSEDTRRNQEHAFAVLVHRSALERGVFDPLRRKEWGVWYISKSRAPQILSWLYSLQS
jgi:hypothetical protein